MNKSKVTIGRISRNHLEVFKVEKEEGYVVIDVVGPVERDSILKARFSVELVGEKIQINSADNYMRHDNAIDARAVFSSLITVRAMQRLLA